MTRTNAKRCILASMCKDAGSPKCTGLCTDYIQLHSATGRHTAAGLPKKYGLTTLDNTPVRTEQAAAYKWIDAYSETFSRQFDPDASPIKSIYLWSPEPGTGKTTTAAALANEFLRVSYVGALRNGRQPKRRPVYFLDVNEHQTLYNKANRSGVPEDIREEAGGQYFAQMERAKQADFTVLDDIGVRDATDAFRGDLHDVIDYRMIAELPTVYTSNIPMDEIDGVYDARLADRIREQCKEIPFVGGSKRGLRK